MPAGAVPFLKVLSWTHDQTTFLELGGNPWILRTEQRRRQGLVTFLKALSSCSRNINGAARVKVDVSLGMGPLGTMYAIFGVLSTTPFLGPPKPSRSLADFPWHIWVVVRWFVLAVGLGLVVEVSALVVTWLGCSVVCLIVFGMRLDYGSLYHSRQGGCVCDGCGG